MSQDEKLDEALKGTFPASDAFYLAPDNTESFSNDQLHPHQALGLVEHAGASLQGLKITKLSK